MIRTESGSTLDRTSTARRSSLRPRIGMEEADDHAVHPFVPEHPRELAKPRLVEGAVHRPVGEPSLRYLEAQRALDEGLRMIEVDVVDPGAGLAADLEEVAEPLAGDEGDLAAAALDERVRADGRAVGEVRDLRRREPFRGQHLSDPVDDRPIRPLGGRGQLVEDGPAPAAARRVVDRDHEVREGAADIDPDVQPSLRFRHGSRSRSRGEARGGRSRSTSGAVRRRRGTRGGGDHFEPAAIVASGAGSRSLDRPASRARRWSATLRASSPTP